MPEKGSRTSYPGAEAIRREEPQNIGEELADGFAWMGALANLYGVDLEEAFLKKCPSVCFTCRQKPCVCTD